MSTVHTVWEGAGNDDHKPGDLPNFFAPTQPTRIGRCTNGYYINVTSLSASPYPKAMLFYFSEIKKRVKNLLKKGSFN